MAACSQCASDLDAATQAQLGRGARLTELLKQPQNTPYPVEETVAVLFAGTRGFLDKVPVDKVVAYERQMLGELRASDTGILDAIRDAREIKKDVEDKLTAFLTDFTRRFTQG